MQFQLPFDIDRDGPEFVMCSGSSLCVPGSSLYVPGSSLCVPGSK